MSLSHIFGSAPAAAAVPAPPPPTAPPTMPDPFGPAAREAARKAATGAASRAGRSASVLTTANRSGAGTIAGGGVGQAYSANTLSGS